MFGMGFVFTLNLRAIQNSLLSSYNDERQLLPEDTVTACRNMTVFSKCNNMTIKTLE